MAPARRRIHRNPNPPIARPLIDLAPPEERAILVGAPLKRGNARLQREAADEHLAELARLADTAGAHVVGQLTQQIERPDPGTYIGSGKLEELKALVTDARATVVIFDDELSPAQGKNLEGELTKRVIDRAELILDIFALRARSAEARMQVELAQLEYSLPRLRNLWTHLEKFRGGIGVRGPGETQLETDRRLVGQRIAMLKQRLRDVATSRAEQRKGRKRSMAYRAALVGYTNAGKSSILRAMSGATDIVVEDRLFATLDTVTREVRVGSWELGVGSSVGSLELGVGSSVGSLELGVQGRRELPPPNSKLNSKLPTPSSKLLLTDSVGFIRKLPHHLVASFRATLDEVREADMLLHVIDAANPLWEEQRLVVDEVLGEVLGDGHFDAPGEAPRGLRDKPVIHVFNKTDRLAPAALDALRARMADLLPGSVFVSAAAPGGMEPLHTALAGAARQGRPVVELRLSPSDGKRLAEIHRVGEVISTAHDEASGEMVVRARMRAEDAARLRGGRG